MICHKIQLSTVDWDFRIHRQHHCRVGTPPPHNECIGYDIKQSEGEVPVMLELYGMWTTPSLLSLPGPFWFGGIAHDKVLSIGHIKVFDIQTES